MRALLLDPLRNRLLAALPQPDFALIARHLATTSMPAGLVLNEVDDSVHQVYFPIKGMLSLLAILGNGKAIETATVGREGVVNAMAGLGLLKSNVRVVVQIPLDVVNGARNLPTCGGPIFPTWAGMVISPRCDRGSRS